MIPVTTIPLPKMQHKFIYLNNVPGLEGESAVHITALSEPLPGLSLAHWVRD